MRKVFEFGKFIAVVSAMSSLVLTGIVVYMTFQGIDTSNLTIITTTAWAETAASNIAYYSKAKKENIPKVIMGIYKGLSADLKRQVDINTLMQNLLQ